jgi:hypothetical protein
MLTEMSCLVRIKTLGNQYIVAAFEESAEMKGNKKMAGKIKF